MKEAATMGTEPPSPELSEFIFSLLAESLSKVNLALDILTQELKIAQEEQKWDTEQKPEFLN